MHACTGKFTRAYSAMPYDAAAALSNKITQRHARGRTHSPRATHTWYSVVLRVLSRTTRLLVLNGTRGAAEGMLADGSTRD